MVIYISIFTIRNQYRITTTTTTTNHNHDDNNNDNTDATDHTNNANNTNHDINNANNHINNNTVTVRRQGTPSRARLQLPEPGRLRHARLGVHFRAVQWEGGAVDGG